MKATTFSGSMLPHHLEPITEGLVELERLWEAAKKRDGTPPSPGNRTPRRPSETPPPHPYIVAHPFNEEEGPSPCRFPVLTGYFPPDLPLPDPHAEGAEAKRKSGEGARVADSSVHIDAVPLRRVPPLPERLRRVAMGSAPHNNNNNNDNNNGGSAADAEESVASFPSCCQYAVVLADVKRSLWELYPEEGERELMRAHLRQVILRVFYHAANENCHYSQGMNDLVGHLLFWICSYRSKVLYRLQQEAPELGVVAGAETPEAAAAQLEARLELVVSVCATMIRTLWRPFTLPDLTEVDGLSAALHHLLEKEDAGLWKLLQQLHLVHHPHYVLSWMLTWYMAGLSNTIGKMQLLVYFLQSQDVLSPVYLGSALLLRASAEFQHYVHDQLTVLRCSKNELFGPAFSKLSSVPAAVLEGKPPTPNTASSSSSSSSRYFTAQEELDGAEEGPQDAYSEAMHILHRQRLVMRDAEVLRQRYAFHRILQPEDEVEAEKRRHNAGVLAQLLPSFRVDWIGTSTRRSSSSSTPRLVPRYVCYAVEKSTVKEWLYWYGVPAVVVGLLAATQHEPFRDRVVVWGQAVLQQLQQGS